MSDRKSAVNLNEISQNLAKISQIVSGINISANTFLKMGKATPENLRAYRFHNGRFEFPKLLILLFLFLPLSIYEISRQVFRTIAFKERKPDFLDTANMNYDSLFVSHFTPAATDAEDLYFGSLPSSNQSVIGNSAVFILNHTRMNTVDLYKLLKSRKNSAHFINSKSVPVRDLLGIVNNQFVVGFQMVRKAILPNSHTIGLRILLIHAAIKQFSKPTIAAIVFVENLEAVVANVNPKRLIITFEGHSFELLALKMIHNKFPNVRVMLYQFAPLVRTQFSFFETLKELHQFDLVFTTGRTTQKYILENARLSKNQVVILGSPKALASNSNMNFEWKRLPRELVCLFAAEASEQDTYGMLDLALKCSRALPNTMFILRLHPAYLFEKAELVKTIKGFPANLRLSDRSLEEDLRVASFCVYRSTAVVIQGLIQGVRPIHYSSFTENELDPLAITSLWHVSVTNASQLVSYFDSIEVRKLSTLSPSLDEMTSAYNDYFQPLSVNAIVNS